MHFLAHCLGLDDSSGGVYLFWSGFGSDLAEFTLIGIVYKKLNCHQSGCYRIGLHHVGQTGLITCRKHHPILSKKKQ